MLDDVFKDRAASEGEPPPLETRKSSLSLAPMLLLPLAFLLLVGSIVFLFGLLSSDDRTPLDLLREIRAGSGEGRALAAYELSRQGSYDFPPGLQADFVSLAVAIFQDEAGGDPRVRRSLALTLGRTGDTGAVPALIRSLDDPDIETQLYSIWALGSIADPRAVELILSKLDHDDAGIRKMAGFALGQIGDPRAIPGLRAALQDKTRDVAWNAAVALARLGDRSGLPTLLSLLDRRQMRGIARLSPRSQEELMINVLRSLRGLAGGPVGETLRHLAETDPSARIRSEARKALEGKASSPTFPRLPPR